MRSASRGIGVSRLLRAQRLALDESVTELVEATRGFSRLCDAIKCVPICSSITPELQKSRHGRMTIRRVVDG